jgi:hypothetical protein
MPRQPQPQDKAQREQHRLDGDVGELQRLARDVHEVAAGEHEDIGGPLREAARGRRPQDRCGILVALYLRLHELARPVLGQLAAQAGPPGWPSPPATGSG